MMLSFKLMEKELLKEIHCPSMHRPASYEDSFLLVLSLIDLNIIFLKVILPRFCGHFSS